jgi:outer membrane protein assembly factor BamB
MNHTRPIAVALLAVASLPLAPCQADGRLVELLDDRGVTGGLVVCLDRADLPWDRIVADRPGLLVHVLDADGDAVVALRAKAREARLDGRLLVEHWTQPRLPHADGLARALVCTDRTRWQEILRVCSPGADVLVCSDQGWTHLPIPRTEHLDEWTHFLYDASNNAVSADRLVAPPTRMQWVAGPRWARSHEHLASVSVVVSAGRRVFSIQDEGPIASVTLPSDWKLVARDAFSGVTLWKRDIPLWEGQLRPFRSGPPEIHRRLVADGNRLYATLGYGQPVTAIDAASGETLHTCKGTEHTAEILHRDGVLYLVIGKPENAYPDKQPLTPLPAIRNKRIQAVRASDGKVLWTRADKETASLLPQSLAVADGRVVFQNPLQIVCLDAGTGEVHWRADRPVSVARRAWSTTTLVIADDVVVSADAGPGKGGPADATDRAVRWQVTHAGGGGNGTIAAFSARTGEPLWSDKAREGYNFPIEVLVIDGELWSGELIRSREPGYRVVRDLRTGEVTREFAPEVSYYNPGMGHHRCYRNKATAEFILTGRSGIEYVDVETGKPEPHNWVRGTCQFGILPANGLTYAPPHSCACYLNAKLNGFWALRGGAPGEPDRPETRHVKGPAFGKVSLTLHRTEANWPAYRHDAARTGAGALDARGSFDGKLAPDWSVELGPGLSPPTIADGRVYVARKDAGLVHALDAQTGRTLWTYPAAGRVDTPPTVAGEAVLFGSADGWATCLRASDGEVVWRFRAAPRERRIVAFDRVESAWPVHGSVLLADGSAYVAAGRSSFLGGGIHLYRLDAQTGEVQAHRVVTHRDPKTGRQPNPRKFEMDGALTDVLSFSGGKVFMRHLAFDAETLADAPTHRHLYSPTGFLDDSWWHRSYWMYGQEYDAGWSGWWHAGNRVPAGRVMVVGGDRVFGFGRTFYPAGNAGQWNRREGYHLYATSDDARSVRKPQADNAGQGGTRRRRRNRAFKKPAFAYHWSREPGFQARAMALAGRVLLAAGPLGEGHIDLDAFRGRKGVVLATFDAVTGGREIDRVALEALPVFDALAVGAGRAVVCTVDGRVRAFAPASK